MAIDYFIFVLRKVEDLQDEKRRLVKSSAYELESKEREHTTRISRLEEDNAHLNQKVKEMEQHQKKMQSDLTMARDEAEKQKRKVCLSWIVNSGVVAEG